MWSNPSCSFHKSIDMHSLLLPWPTEPSSSFARHHSKTVCVSVCLQHACRITFPDIQLSILILHYFFSISKEWTIWVFVFLKYWRKYYNPVPVCVYLSAELSSICHNGHQQPAAGWITAIFHSIMEHCLEYDDGILELFSQMYQTIQRSVWFLCFLQTYHRGKRSATLDINKKLWQCQQTNISKKWRNATGTKVSPRIQFWQCKHIFRNTGGACEHISAQVLLVSLH